MPIAQRRARGTNFEAPFEDFEDSMTRSWQTHKFGGTSLADSDAYRAVSEIVVSRSGPRQAVVVSAAAGTTDALIDLVDRAGRPETSFDDLSSALRNRQAELTRGVLGDEGSVELIALLDKEFADIEDVLRATRVMRTAVESAVGAVAGFGEVWSARLLAAHLKTLGHHAVWLDAREVLVVRAAEPAPAVEWDITRERLTAWLSDHDEQIVVITGFVASDATGAATTLGRNGSDYSAAIFASLLEADELTIWTDVDGVMSADPRLVPQAEVLEGLSYDEAMELAYFGAKVIHPATLTPAIRNSIPVTIRNTFNPGAPGSRIAPDTSSGMPVKGFASIGDMALINLEGTAMMGVPGISERLFGALRASGVSVVMISQGSSEHSICFAVPESHAERARVAVEQAFAAESQRGLFRDLEVTTGVTILAAVGDGMSGTPGIAARLFGSLVRAGVNVKAIAQGSSERNISVVIDSADATKALRAAHSGFYLSRQTLSIGVIGHGHVGGTLLDQMAGRLDWLREEFSVDLRVRAIAGSQSMLLDDNQIDLRTWRERLTAGGADTHVTDLDLLAQYIHTESVPHAAIIDCTASETVAARYGTWLGAGIHVITPNKKANTASLDYYRELQSNARRADAHYFYETTVGAALPIIQTLRDLVQTGDVVRRIEGVFSGTLSYLFNSFDGSVPFSEIVRAAKDKGYTEPDPREDLSGMDVARKVVILAREMGMEAGLEDMEIQGLIPPGLEEGGVDEFLQRLSDYDAEMLQRVAAARSDGKVLRFVGVIDPTAGTKVALRSFDSDHPFARIKLTDNIVTFQTDRYSENPLVVQGPGAGPAVTAGGVFADLLRLANYLGATL
ncbi:MAG TPA: bifunctional aspartate kinase/homoserine dehydrogenase I [Acidimicrobiia bacterium]|nr:bifunctional aspartate kinase/homoserine dehydrogenase I [Acidimicrobiia bacterium]